MATLHAVAERDASLPNPSNDAGPIAWRDHKIAFAVEHCSGQDVLDLGCVQHDPRVWEGRFWVHKALRARARSVLGLDYCRHGVDYLSRLGFDIILGDAQGFRLDRDFDVIFAGDLIEHLEDFHGFFKSCKAHLRPGGRLLISTPNPWYWRQVAHAALRAAVPNNPEHTCWMDPQTLRQLAARHGMKLSSVQFGSRYAVDRFMPLPRGIKHTSWHGVLTVDHGTFASGTPAALAPM